MLRGRFTNDNVNRDRSHQATFSVLSQNPGPDEAQTAHPNVISSSIFSMKPVLEVIPIDQGHFGLPYYDHILRGLRLSFHEEVRSLLRDGTMPSSGEFVGLGGVAVVNI